MTAPSGRQRYRIFGLNVCADLPLIGLTSEPGIGFHEIDLDVTFTEAAGALPRTPDPVSVQWSRGTDSDCLLYTTADGHTLAFTFRDNGRRLHVSTSSPGAAESIASVFLGPAMAAALHLRGSLVLHGAAVVSRERAVLVLGGSGAGKSTLASALVSAGAPLLSEEVIAIDGVGRGDCVVRAGHAGISVGRNTLAMLGLQGHFPLVQPEQPLNDKRWVDARTLEGGAWHGEAVSLGSICIIERGTAETPARIDVVPPYRATLALLRQTYGPGWLTPPSAALMDACSALAAKVPVHIVTMPDRLDRVAEVARTLLTSQLPPWEWQPEARR